MAMIESLIEQTPPSDRRPLRERLMVLRKSLNNFRQDLRQYDQSSSTVGQKAAAEIDREPAVATTGEGSSQKGNASKVIVNTSHDYCEDYADCPYDDLWSECQSYD